MGYSTSLANQMKHRDREMVPLFLVRAMFALMFGAVALVTYAQVTDRPQIGVVPDSPIVKEITVTLDGTRSDGVYVLNENGDQIAYSNADKAGFIDVIWVSVNRARTVKNVPLTEPLRVVRRANGHTAILDDSTGWSIELIGYGQDNVAAFARLLD